MTQAPARLRENPACNPACGACHYKDLDYGAQQARKQAWAKSKLARWEELLAPIRPAPEAERLAYRSKTWLRSSFQEGALSFGMYRAIQLEGRWTQEFVSWDTCPLHLRSIQEMTRRLGQVLAQQAPEFAANSLFGVWMGTPHLVIVAKEDTKSLLKTIEWDRVLCPPFNRAWLHLTSQVGRKVFQHRDFRLLSGPPPDDEHPILAFRQIARTLLTEARRRAVDSLLASRPSLIVDLYCGTGELSRLLPPSVSWLGIELSRDAAAYAGRLRNSSAEATHESFVGTIEDRLLDSRVKSRIAAPYALYLNPPRTGLGPLAQERVLTLLREKPATAVVFLSCSASSLARDLAVIEDAGYHVTELQPYDFFPQTEHFEILAVLTPTRL